MKKKDRLRRNKIKGNWVKRGKQKERRRERKQDR